MIHLYKLEDLFWCPLFESGHLRLPLIVMYGERVSYSSYCIYRA